MDKKPAPVCFFTYKRLSETKLAIDALKNNYLSEKTDIYIYSDGPKYEVDSSKVDSIREYLKTITGFKSVTINNSETNLGLAGSIINGVSDVLMKYERVIVLEDDLITSPNFLNFMNQALDRYKNQDNIQTVCGFSVAIDHYSDDVYFQRRPFSWGWATWKDYWNTSIFDKKEIKEQLQNNISLIDGFKHFCGDNLGKMLLGSLDNKNDSWFVRWAFNQFLEKRYSVIPSKSLIRNIGFGIDGTHCKGINPYTSFYADPEQTNFNLIPFSEPDENLTKDFLHYFTLRHKVALRLKLLKHKEGRDLVFDEIRQKLNL
ncbi:glycosyltransferase family 2 protein [Saccharicrinis sp. FJH62]|uniref:glycosyltransferase family 2 protein n=1 Tax=Saccharicrinis sp. FJH62 TaxID=3344657 RepID=UPI0035D50BDC